MVVLRALKKKDLKFILKKLVVTDIRSCLRTQLHQDRNYAVTPSETIVGRYISNVSVALKVWKISAVGEIWVEIQITHIFSSACAGTTTTHEWVALIVWFIIMELSVFIPSPWSAAYHSLLTKKRFGLKIQTIQYQNWAKMANSSQEPMESPFSKFFQTRFFQATFWLNSAYNVIFRVQVRLVQSRQEFICDRNQSFYFNVKPRPDSTA